VTAPSQRLEFVPALTGLRGVAAGAVVAYHLWSFGGKPTLVVLGYPVHALAACGYLGVDLFFVLSAFLLAQPFLAAAAGRRSWPDLSTYFRRRVRRVVPAFWAQVAILFAVGYLVGGAPPFGARTALLHLFFLQGLVQRPGLINEVYWSLPVEWWFYFWIPVVAFMFGRLRWWWIAAAFLAAGVGFRALCWKWHADGDWFGYGNILMLRARIDEFFIGILAAYAHLRVAEDSPWRRRCAIAGMLGLLAGAPWLAARGDIFVNADFPWLLVHFDVVGALFALVVVGCAVARASGRALLASRPVFALGTISYSLYLWHFPVLKWTDVAGLWREAPAGVAATVAIVLMLVVSFLSYRVVERPFVHGGGWWRRTAQPRRAATIGGGG
jgi:peptidoglycan/LPS O-acetylase OafA/YrhL